MTSAETSDSPVMPPVLVPGKRLESLDALRGLTIAAMLLVNNPGSWSYIYWPLEHAAWNGWTLTDLVFPFFLFMVGVAMMFSFPKRLAQGTSRAELFTHVVRRAAALMLLGYWGSTWSRVVWTGLDALTFEAVLLRIGFVAAMTGAVVLLAGTEFRTRWWSIFVGGLVLFVVGVTWAGTSDPLVTRILGLRIPGVLVRIAWCYVLASGIYFLTPSPKAIMKWTMGLLAAYALFMQVIPIPGFGMPDLSRSFPTADTPLNELFSNWAFFIDYHVLGTHTWSVRQLTDATGRLIWSFDPEGIISTISATCSVLLGILTGQWLQQKTADEPRKLNGLFVASGWLMGLGLVLSIWVPINKRIWTSSYTIFTAGMALFVLGVLFHAIDIKGMKKWAYPLVAYGRNAIFAFVASGMMATALGLIQVSEGVSLKAFLYAAMPGSPEMASFLFGILFVSLWAGIAILLDRNRIYFKV
jgi:predicted acyltransferase